MSAPVPFCGFTGFKTRREVTQVLDSYTLSSGGNPAHGGRKLMIGTSAWWQAAELFDPAVAPPERVLRLIETTPAGPSSDEGLPLELIDGVLISGWVPTPEDIAEIAERLPGKRVAMTASSGMYAALNRRRDLMLEVLEAFEAATDFVLVPNGQFALETAVEVISDLKTRFGETRGYGLKMALDHVSVVDLHPLFAPDRFPNLSLAMPLPVDKDGEGDDVEARYILRHAFGMTFFHRK